MTTISDVLENFDYARKPIKAQDRTPGRTPYLGASGVVDYVDGYTHDGQFLCVSEDGENLRSRQVPIAWVQDGKFWANNHLHVLGGVSFPRLKFYEAVVNSTNMAKFLTGSAQPKLSQKNLGQIPAGGLSHELQEKVGGVLGALDAKASTNNLIVSRARNLITATWTQACFGGRLVALDEVIETNPRVPGPVGDVAPYLGMSDIPEFGLIAAGWGERSPRGGARFLNGDTLMARITPCFENGKMVFVDFLDQHLIGSGSTEYIVLRAKKGVPPLAAYAVAAGDRFRDFAARYQEGTSGRQRVRASALNEFKMNWPIKSDLDDFGRLSSDLLDRAAAARNENLYLEKIRNQLLPLLMSGKITVADAESAVQEVH